MVQLRGKEELETGQWSEWSPEVTGTPWIGTWVCTEGGRLGHISAVQYCVANHAESTPPTPSFHFFIQRVLLLVQAGPELSTQLRKP